MISLQLKRAKFNSFAHCHFCHWFTEVMLYWVSFEAAWTLKMVLEAVPIPACQLCGELNVQDKETFCCNKCHYTLKQKVMCSQVKSIKSSDTNFLNFEYKNSSIVEDIVPGS